MNCNRDLDLRKSAPLGETNKKRSTVQMIERDPIL